MSCQTSTSSPCWALGDISAPKERKRRMPKSNRTTFACKPETPPVLHHPGLRRDGFLPCRVQDLWLKRDYYLSCARVEAEDAAEEPSTFWKSRLLRERDRWLRKAQRLKPPAPFTSWGPIDE